MALDPLPAALSRHEDIEAFRRAREEARLRLAALDTHEAALSLAAIFERRPSVMIFHYRPGYEYDAPCVYTNRGHSACGSHTGLAATLDPDVQGCGHDEGDILNYGPRGENEEICHDLLHWIYGLTDDNASRFSAAPIVRPTGEPLIPGIFRQLLGPADFALWEAACLDPAVSAAPGSRRSPSL